MSHRLSPARAKVRGASKLELVLVCLMLSTLSFWLLHTFRFYQELTEKTVVESTIVNARSGLRLKIADLIIKETGDMQLKLEKTNPVLFLDMPPRGYLGEMRAPGNLPPGSWYFDQDKAELVYIPDLIANLDIEGKGQKSPRLRWQIRANKGSVVQMVDVELLTPYEWFK